MKMFECAGCGTLHASNVDVPDACSVCGGDMVPAWRDIDEALSLDPFFDARRHEGVVRVLPTAPVNDNDIRATVSTPAAWRTRGALVLGVVAVALFVGAGVLAAGDMERCQRSHSFDTCFSTLNR